MVFIIGMGLDIFFLNTNKALKNPQKPILQKLIGGNLSKEMRIS
jgi:hypothetical protein